METLQYRGRTEAERLEAAIYYDRINGMIERMQRTGFPLTSGDIEALKFCVDVLVIVPQETAQAPASQGSPAQVDDIQEPVPRARTGARLRDV